MTRDPLPERDERYHNMWRVRLPDASLSDMVNWTRAREVARILRRELESGNAPAHPRTRARVGCVRELVERRRAPSTQAWGGYFC